MTLWATAQQVSLSSTISQSLLKFMSTEMVMLSNHLILCPPPHVPPGLGLRIPLAPSPVLPGSRPAVASRQPGTNPSYKSLGGFRSPESLRRVDQPQEPAGRKLSQLTMMPSPGTPASRMPASPPGELVSGTDRTQTPAWPRADRTAENPEPCTWQAAGLKPPQLCLNAVFPSV